MKWQDRLILAQILGMPWRIAVESLAKHYGPRCLPLLSGRAAWVAIQHYRGEMAGISGLEPAILVRIDRQMSLF